MFPPVDAAALHLNYAVRVLPHQNNTGGFFVACFRKTKELPSQVLRSKRIEELSANKRAHESLSARSTGHTVRTSESEEGGHSEEKQARSFCPGVANAHDLQDSIAGSTSCQIHPSSCSTDTSGGGDAAVECETSAGATLGPKTAEDENPLLDETSTAGTSLSNECRSGSLSASLQPREETAAATEQISCTVTEVSGENPSFGIVSEDAKTQIAAALAIEAAGSYAGSVFHTLVPVDVDGGERLSSVLAFYGLSKAHAPELVSSLAKAEVSRV